jgi:hypothetical protein
MKASHHNSPGQARTSWLSHRTLIGSLKLRLWANGGPNMRSEASLTLLRNSRPRDPRHGTRIQRSTSIPHPPFEKQCFVGSAARVQQGRHDMGPTPLVPEVGQEHTVHSRPRASGKRTRTIRQPSVQPVPRRTLRH